MAYCKECGAKLNDGAKFCPKCGTPTDNPFSHDEDYEDKEGYDERPKKSGCWSTAIAVIAVIFVIGFFYNKCGGDDSEKQQTEQVNQETDINENSGLSKKEKEIAEEGYKNGYSQGFSFDEWSLEHYGEKDYKDFARNSYLVFHKVPSSSEEQELYALYEENFLKGIKEGVMAQEGTEREESKKANQKESEKKQVAEAGYERGYELGFAGRTLLPNEARIRYTSNFGAPSNSEKMELFKIYEENFERGYQEGRNAR